MGIIYLGLIAIIMSCTPSLEQDFQNPPDQYKCLFGTLMEN